MFRLDDHQPEAIHLATEGPLGWAARKHCLRRSWAFTTAFHTKFPEILHAAAKVPLRWIPVPATPVRLSETPGEIRHRAPLVGEHTDEILQGLGFSEEEIAAYRLAGII